MEIKPPPLRDFPGGRHLWAARPGEAAAGACVKRGGVMLRSGRWHFPSARAATLAWAEFSGEPAMAALLQEEAFLDEILAHPADDTPRLIYADWLEIERGEAERAEFIRVQIELASDERCDIAQWPADLRDTWENRNGWLRRRERELLVRVAHPDPPWWSDLRRRVPGVNLAVGPDQFPAGSAVAVMRRGFIAEVRCPLDAWEGHGPALCREHPIEGVEITDRGPDDNREHHGRPYWWRSSGGEYALPGWLFDRLAGGERCDRDGAPDPAGDWRDYSSVADARAALNAAAILWAQRRARPRP